MSSKDISTNDIINNKYRIIKLIGTGGLGRVFQAVHLEQNRVVAIKFLNENFINNPDVQGVFHRELLLTSKLKHKNIIGYIDSHFNPPSCYIVSEFIDGWNAYQFSKIVRRVPPLVALAICADLLQGVDYLHLHDIVHSDISIANVMLSKSGRVFLTDFGFSVDPAIESYSNQHFGTPGYYSPEHVTRANINYSSDIYCVGLILWKLIVGTSIITASKDSSKIVNNMKNLPINKINISDKDLHASLTKIFKKSLSYRQFFRYSQAKQMSYDCFRILTLKGLSYPRAGILQYLIDNKLTHQRFALPKQSIYLE